MPQLKPSPVETGNHTGDRSGHPWLAHVSLPCTRANVRPVPTLQQLEIEQQWPVPLVLGPPATSEEYGKRVAVSAGLCLESIQNSTANRHLETKLLVPRHGCASVRSVEA